jgi:phosphatidylglycerol:prolipoprotein diacylglycerol transferase
VATAWFDSGLGTEPYAALVRYTGRRIGTPGHPGSRDAFVQDETIAEIVPGTGPVSITTRVYGLQAGDWTVSSEVADRPIKVGTGGSGARPGRGRTAHPASWSWRHWAVSTGPAVPLRTRWGPLAPFASQPAVIPGIYTVLAVLSITLAVAVQSAILARGNVPVDRSLLASGITIAAGLTGAKVWYAILHPRESIIRGGWAVDGFLIVLPPVGAGALLLLDLPIGEVLDATTPGLFVAVAIGRIGCFLTGCCAGRLTAGSWGIWSSDRRVGARRVPTQLLESATGLVIGGATLAVVLGGATLVPGAIFVISFAAYTVVRQGLLRLRSERRESARTVPLTAAAAGAVVTAVAVVSAVQGT